MRSFIALALLLLIIGESAFAQTATPTILPPSLTDVQSATQLNQIFTSCTQDPIIDQVKNLFSGSGRKGITAGKLCDGPSTIGGSSTSCDAFKAADGSFDPARLNAALANAGKVEATLACKRTKLSGIEAELGCFQARAGMLQNQMGQLQQIYSKYLSDAQPVVDDFDSTLRDRVAQMEDIKAKLEGGPRQDGSDAGNGLRKALADITALKQQMRDGGAGIPRIRALYAELDTQRDQFESLKAREKSAQALACMEGETLEDRRDGKTGLNAFSCDGIGASTNAKDYALCRAEQNARIVGGQFAQDAGTIARAAERRKALENLFKRIENDVPKGGGIPTTPEEVANAGKQAARILTPQDFQRVYGRELAAFGQDIANTVMAKFNSCYARKQNEIENTTDKLSQFNVVRDKMDKTAANIIDFSNGLARQFTDRYNDAVRTLTGDGDFTSASRCEVPITSGSALNPSGAPKVSGTKLLACLESQRLDVDRLMEGGTPVGLNILGSTKPKTALGALTCTGLAGCVKKLENATRQLAGELKRQTEAKRAYIFQTNQKLQKFTQDMQRILDPQSKFLNQQMEGIKGALGGLGGNAGDCNVEPSTPTTLRPGPGANGEGGLLSLEGVNMVDLIGGSSSPPFPKIAGTSFDSCRAAFADKRKEIDESEKEFRDKLADLKSAESTCRAADIDKSGSKLINSLNLYVQECTKSDANALAKDKAIELVDSVRDILSGFGESLQEVDSAILEGFPSGESELEAAKDDFRDRYKSDCTVSNPGNPNGIRACMAELPEKLKERFGRPNSCNAIFNGQLRRAVNEIKSKASKGTSKSGAGL